jgi:hypothetical protein
MEAVYQKTIDKYFTPANKARFMSLASSNPIIQGDQWPVSNISSTNCFQFFFGAPRGLLADDSLGPERTVEYGRFHFSYESFSIIYDCLVPYSTSSPGSITPVVPTVNISLISRLVSLLELDRLY